MFIFSAVYAQFCEVMERLEKLDSGLLQVCPMDDHSKGVFVTGLSHVDITLTKFLYWEIFCIINKLYQDVVSSIRTFFMFMVKINAVPCSDCIVANNTAHTEI